MKILLFSRPHTTPPTDEVRRIFDAARAHGFEVAVNREFAPEAERITGLRFAERQLFGERIGAQPEGTFMICYGGDGTLLEGARRLHGAAIPVAGINSGRLGFLTTTPPDGIGQLFDDLAAGHVRTEERTLIEASGGFAEAPDTPLALNEFAIQRHGAGMISVETYVDRQMVATYHGDGVLVSTPTGSTAYSLSAGGPVVSPRCACLILSPLAPHNLTMRPVVIPDTSEITLRIRARQAGASVTLDNRIYAAADGAEFTVRRSERRFFLAVPHNITFYDTLRNKMMWGIDIRS